MLIYLLSKFQLTKLLKNYHFTKVVAFFNSFLHKNCPKKHKFTKKVTFQDSKVMQDVVTFLSRCY